MASNGKNHLALLKELKAMNGPGEQPSSLSILIFLNVNRIVKILFLRLRQGVMDGCRS